VTASKFCIGTVLVFGFTIECSSRELLRCLVAKSRSSRSPICCSATIHDSRRNPPTGRWRHSLGADLRKTVRRRSPRKTEPNRSDVGLPCGQRSAFQQIYDIETRGKKMSADNRWTLRQSEAKPIWESLGVWLDSPAARAILRRRQTTCSFPLHAKSYNAMDVVPCTVAPGYRRNQSLPKMLTYQQIR